MTAKRIPGYRMAYRVKDTGQTRTLSYIWRDLDTLRHYARFCSLEYPKIEFFPVDLDGDLIPEPIPETDAP